MFHEDLAKTLKFRPLFLENHNKLFKTLGRNSLLPRVREHESLTNVMQEPRRRKSYMKRKDMPTKLRVSFHVGCLPPNFSVNKDELTQM